MNKKKNVTTAAGAPVKHYEDSQSVGARGPLLLQDYFLHEKLAHFNRERIPERIVHAKGSGAYGTFTVTHDISKYTREKLKYLFDFQLLEVKKDPQILNVTQEVLP